MGVPIALGYREDAASGAQIVDGGLRFDSGKSNLLTRTFSLGNRQIWTWSGWVKKTEIGGSSNRYLFNVLNGSARSSIILLGSGDKLQVDTWNGSSYDFQLITTQVFRDASSWYHLVVSVDTTQGTTSNRVKIYVNGSQVQDYSTGSYPSSSFNTHVNTANVHYFGAYDATNNHLNAYVSNVYFIDGQQLDPSYFGYTDPLTNVWRPKKFKSPYENTKFNSISTVWSNNLTLSGGSYTTGREPQYGFDGNLTTACQGGTNGTSITLNSLVGLVVNSSIEFYSSFGTGGDNTFTINGSASATMSSTNTWTSVSFTGTISSAVISSSSQNPTFSAIRIDGQILVDGNGWGRNGFYLPFDGSAPIGQDQSGRGNNWTPVNFGGSNTIEKATGALPILNADGGGKVARVGVRTDANASSLVLALPLVGIKSDFSNAVNSGSSNKNVVNTTAVSFVSTTSNFYGGSAYFNGSHRLECDFSQSWTSNFTIEGWIYRSATGSYPTIYDFAAAAAGYGMYAFIDTAASSVLKAQFYSSNSSGSLFVNLTGTAINVDSGWHHFAVVKSGTTYSLYQNGILTSSSTSASNPVTSTTLNIGNRSDETPTNPWYGYIQDFRVYVGAAKYTSNFIPASTDPDIVPDSPSGVSYSSNVALVPSTDGAVAFAGNSSTYLSFASSADFNFGTGDFTIECFIYSTSSSDQRILNGSSPTYEFSATSSGLVFGQSGTFSTTLGGTFTLNKWNHIALVRSGSTVTGYIDGIACPTTHNIGSNSVSFDNSGTLIGRNHLSAGTPSFITGTVSNFHIVKGTALYTSNFTPPSGPISSVANTKLLCCKSNSSATAADVTPGTITANGNATASNFNPFTVNINTQRGKQSGYATLNPTVGATQLGGSTAPTYSDGNSKVSFNGVAPAAGTIGVISGKWYFEVLVNSAASTNNSTGFGIRNGLNAGAYNDFTGYFRGVRHNNSGNLTYSTSGDTGTSAGAIMAAGEVYGIAYDVDNNYFGLYKNGVILASSSSSSLSGGTWFPYAFGDSASGSHTFNFGQKPFKFPPPAGFQPLTLANTPRPTIVRPDQYVGIVTYKGNNSSKVVTGLQFKPDFVWIKSRTTGTSDHGLFDTVRGAGYALRSSTSGIESIPSPNDGFISFDRNGFTMGANNNSGCPDINFINNTDYVAWAWKAGGNSNTFNINDVGYATTTAAGLTAGTIPLTGASVNTKSGFSIITYSSSTTPNIPHGLGRNVSFIIAKSRTVGVDWVVYHRSLGKDKLLVLNGTSGELSVSNYWGTSEPNDTVFGTYGTGSNSNNQGNMVAYCWAEIPGFSKFGSYSGNSSADGVYVATGFKPRWLLVKKSSSTGNERGWVLVDSERSKFNVSNLTLFPHASSAEDAGTYIAVDFLSNGFKLRSTEEAANASYTYIYACFAETPSFNLYGAMSNAR